MRLSVSVISILKFRHTYFIIIAKTSYRENTNAQNNDDKVKKPTLESHSVSINYCNIFAYFHITDNKVKPALIISSVMSVVNMLVLKHI